MKIPFVEESFYKRKIFLPERHGFKLNLDCLQKYSSENLLYYLLCASLLGEAHLRSHKNVLVLPNI